MAQISDDVKRVESRQAQSVDPTERKQMDLELAAQKGELGQLGTLAQQIQAKEAEASSLLLAEQAKWNEVNDLLTSIERLLVPQP
jgi:hypothetical protein